LRTCFDENFYLERYPDVARSGMDPLAHFLLYGGPEGRQPCRWFDSRYYLQEYPDIAAGKGNPLLHFLRHGWKEGRRPNPLFDREFFALTRASQKSSNPNGFIEFVARARRGECVRSAVPFTLPERSYPVATRKTFDNKPVDIIIPVYAGLLETRRCLESLAAATCLTPFRPVLINDASPDPVLAGYLRETVAAHGWVLLENAENLGFANSVNRGLEADPARDIILLNNDTEVANDWLDRLAAAGREGRTGTATPFTNHGTLASYPKPGQGQELPEGTTVAELDRIFAEVNAGQRVKIPTGVGFCMYIRRDCLREVGGFRPEVFGRGYGEENDFCLRAIYKGWENVLAADVFVYHAGETSFGSEAGDRRTKAVETLDRLYPDYRRMLGDYDRRDPAKRFRIAASGERMRRSGKAVILTITHDLGGGVAQYVGELRESVGQRAEMLSLTPTESGAVIFRNLDPKDDFWVAFDPELDYPELIELLRYCGVSRIHVQHLLGHQVDVVRLKNDLEVPLDVSVHDYFFLCRKVTLTNAAGQYCGGPEGGCGECSGRTVKFAGLLDAADRVIAPSRDAANRMRRHFPEAKMLVAEHPSTPPTVEPQPRKLGTDAPLTIGILGAMTAHKGIHRLRACASAAKEKLLPLRFVLVGYVEKGPGGEPFLETGPYNNDALPGILREQGIDAIWFPAQWPETFSYTLSVCLESGLPVIAPDLGAFTERLAGRSWSWIVPWNLDSEQMVQFFLTIRREHFVTGMSPPILAPAGRREGQNFYPEKYLAGELTLQMSND